MDKNTKNTPNIPQENTDLNINPNSSANKTAHTNNQNLDEDFKQFNLKAKEYVPKKERVKEKEKDFVREKSDG